MAAQYVTNKKILLLASGIILLLSVIYFWPGRDVPEIDSGFKPHLGEWKVIEFTGHVNYVAPGSGKWCEPKTERYSPILDEELTFIKFLHIGTEPLFKNKLDSTDAGHWNETINAKGLFIFQFSFDNGEKTNKGLAAYGVPFHETEILKGLRSMEIGYWGEKSELEGKQFGTLKKDDLDNGFVVIGQEMGSTSGGGHSSFEVAGHFNGEDRIEGRWVLEDVSGDWGALKTYCPWEAKGSGTWTAVRK
ncbi:hypothetical protein ACT6NV_06425 [Robiginitalea sp. IMCC44478]|uniref:hypothetical protein n=1 Tax=Robiginitalea sp. IMCC44478 TaxID=3459122 RepID=UPI0040419A49